tara:strand:+ start:421 stop:1767 length:1347 start_codon:yes stop_codon:yes gene_type:complete
MSSDFLPNEEYPFDDIQIKTPKALQGGTYSAQIELNNKPLVIQTPKCKTKKGIHKTSKQIYCDLLFTKENTENIVFINWLNTLQEKVRDLILDNGDNWFHEKPSIDEVEYNWNDSIRTYKGTFNLIRTFIFKNKSLNKLNIQIYDDTENELHLENIDENKHVICILEVKGLKFSSQSFHLEIFLRQVMILNEKPIFSKCLIKTSIKKQNDTNLVKNDKTLEDYDDIQEETLENSNENSLQNDKKINMMINSSNNNDTTNTSKEISNDNSTESNHNAVENNVENDIENDVENDDVEKTDGNKDKEPNVSLNNNNITEHIEETTNNDNNSQQEKKETNQQDNLEKKQETLDKNIKESLENNQKNDISIPNNLKLENELEEFNINISEAESIKLKNANDVYLDIYKRAREKAKKARNEAIKAYLEVKRIKELYMLDVADSSDDEELEDYSE